MSLSVQESPDEGLVTIRVDGRFDFNVHRDFRDAYKQMNGSVQRYVVDLANTEYMDSSALGMLLLLREHAGGDQASVEIVNPTPEIEKVLRISNFHRLFDIG